MRLICPNCDAQYEVDDNAIPDGGRDVQCSSCGHAWFQLSPEAEAAMLAEEELFGSAEDAIVAVEPVAETEPDPMPEPAAEPEPAPAPEPAAPRRPLDESLRAVLREEAEREAQQRRSEDPQPIETQTDLGLEDTSGAAALAARRRIAQMKGEPEPAPPKPAQRRDLLPDIEEINSSLRASSEPRHDGDMPAPAPQSRAAFRSGFVLMMIIAVVLVLAYVMAPRIAQQIPGSAGAMASYVAGVDQVRLWMDGLMQSAVSALNGTGG